MFHKIKKAIKVWNNIKGSKIMPGFVWNYLIIKTAPHINIENILNKEINIKTGVLFNHHSLHWFTTGGVQKVVSKIAFHFNPFRSHDPMIQSYSPHKQNKVTGTVWMQNHSLYSKCMRELQASNLVERDKSILCLIN